MKDCIMRGTKTQQRAEPEGRRLERGWLVEWEYGWEPALDRTAKERHIRLHCMHMPGEMGTDRHSAAKKPLPEPTTIFTSAVSIAGQMDR